MGVVTLAVYWPATGYQFVDVDDDAFVFGNHHVQQGLTGEGIAWAFTTEHASNWLPLTFISLMADTTFWGTDPGGYHTVNVILHALNAVLLFLVMRRLTGHVGACVFVAAAFALHPLRVESVAWVSERKDVLSTAFWLGTTWFYARWVRSRRTLTYVAMAGALALGLLSKAMLVTLPATLLLLDVWPLRRSESWGARVREKLPLFALVLAAAVATYLAQSAGGAVSAVDRIPLAARVTNAVVAYAIYVVQLFWPDGLSYLYLHPTFQEPGGSWGAPRLAAAVALVGAMTGLALFLARRGWPVAMVGWFWFLGTLVPVIGLVQVGVQSHADRYTYVPHLGLLLILAFAGVELMRRRPRLRVAVMGAAVAAVGAAGALTLKTLPTWRDSETLFRHAIAQNDRNYYALTGLGAIRGRAGFLDEGLPYLRRAIQIQPNFAEARVNLGSILFLKRQMDEAEEHLRVAKRLEPDSLEAAINLGNVLMGQSRFDAAMAEYQLARRLDARSWQAWMNIGLLHYNQGQTTEAIRHLEHARSLAPANPQIQALLRRIRGGG